jgi:hypothetical protein
MDIWKVLSPGGIFTVLVRLLIDTHTHEHRNRSILRHHISISSTHEGVHMSTHSTIHMDICIHSHVSVRILYAHTRGRWHNILRGSVVDGRCAQSLWHCHLNASILLAILHHTRLLLVHILQAAEQQEEAVEE